MQKQVSFKVKGMQRDLSASAFSPEYAYENKNIRIMPTDENTLLSVTNEKGNKFTNIHNIGDSLIGTPIGQTIINNEFIIFTAGDDDYRTADIRAESSEVRSISPCSILITDLISTESDITDISVSTSAIEDINYINCPYKLNIDVDSMIDDRIYKLWFNNGILTGKRLFRGNLNFSYKNPIELISFYENNNIRKVYWTDGLNQPRVINVAASNDIISKWNNTSFDFIASLKLKEEITINRNLVANGIFPPGVIQYAFTYFNKYGRETNIFYTSSLFYISYNNRGASPEDKVGNSFDIHIDNVDNDFDYVRIYSIERTSIDSTPECKIVADLSPVYNAEKKHYEIDYTDNGTTGNNIDPTELLYIGGEEVVFGTMSQKDNTLFLGDIELKRRLIDSTIRNYFRKKPITFSSFARTITTSEAKGLYPYNNQLKLNSSQFKTFKYLEWYRFGVQFQHYTGRWSEPIWINDVKNTSHIFIGGVEGNEVNLPTASFTISDFDIIARLKSMGYIKIRPLVVYPSLSERECICQGILCPTVYNVEDRIGNSPFAQSSWFTRANASFDITKSSNNIIGLNSDESMYNIYSKGGVLSNKTSIYEDVNFLLDTINKGRWAEFRHNYPIPDNKEGNAEIQCISNPPECLVTTASSESDINSWVSQNKENFYVDQSIVTLHSPDIEFDNNVRSLDTSGLKLRIVGLVPLTAFAGDIDIQTSTPPNTIRDSTEVAPGFYKEPIGDNNLSYFGYRGLMGAPFWFDELSDPVDKVHNSKKLVTAFMVYPFHRNGSLNNTKSPTDGYRSAMLKYKKLSNLRFSYNTNYLDNDNIWKPSTGISGVVIFDSNEKTLVRLPSPKNSGLPDINYYGNVDKVLTVSRFGDKKDGYPIIAAGTNNADTYAHKMFTANLSSVKTGMTNEGEKQVTNSFTGTDPVRMKYKSTPHAVLALNYAENGYQWVLPTIKESDGVSGSWSVNIVNKQFPDEKKLFWDSKKVSSGIYQSVLNKYSDYGFLWLGELYNDTVQNRFGGQTEESFENNLWIPAGKSVELDTKGVTISWLEGDTYYQRYDHIKTYPYTLEDQNAITDIVSFMCETRINLDGRYDRNRGQTSNLAITPENFNKMNDVYSQQNNFFNYRGLNHNKLNLDNFHNSITWTKTKTAGEIVDTWTNITLASTLDLDGDKGDIRAIRRLNNNLIAFQDRGISQILYNENMQISSTEGIPIEIANSGKVNGKRYLSDKIGCANKWSICETPNGIYFIDDTTKGIFLFNGKLNNLSDKLGFHSWINAKSNGINIWNPVDFNGFVSYYDKINGDVFFISEDECLAFSEPLAQFTSFYSYEHTPYFINLEDRGIAINTVKGGTVYKVWLHNEGDYNMYFGKYQPFYTTVIANPDMPLDKIFNNLEFRADSWNKNILLNTTFDTLTTWNEYQVGTATLNNILGRPSELKKKFRIWRANIPRANANGRDRMRNPWLYIKLSMENENVNKTILHDMIVHYFE